jgi:hypothetical protein
LAALTALGTNAKPLVREALVAPAARARSSPRWDGRWLLPTGGQAAEARDHWGVGKW